MVDFINPVKSNTTKLTSPYGYRIHPIKKVKAMHGGVDLICTKTKHPPIVASADGTVRLVKDTGNSGYGKYIIIRHTINGKIFETVYAHLKSMSVKVGQKVKQGEVIGVMGSSGSSTGSHAHFEVHNQPYNYGGGKYPSSVDPMKYISLNNNTSTNTKGDELTMSQYNEIMKILKEQSLEIQALKAEKANRVDHTQSNIDEMKKALDWTFANKILQGNGSGLNASGTLTRQEFATMLKRYHDNVKK